ncbi:MAG: cytochrome b/b6 domain-containing protein, partial [Alphaproteobacteria bacterium]
MSSLAANDERAVPATATVIQPAWVRIAHWINAVAMIVMIMSGWQIYNASPLFAFKFAKSI